MRNEQCYIVGLDNNGTTLINFSKIFNTIQLVTKYLGETTINENVMEQFKFTNPLALESSDYADVSLFFEKVKVQDTDENSYPFNRIRFSKLKEDLPETVDYVALNKVKEREFTPDDFKYPVPCIPPSKEIEAEFLEYLRKVKEWLGL